MKSAAPLVLASDHNEPIDYTTQTLDIVIPIFNEADGLREFHRRLDAACHDLNVDTRFIYVNDGSKDTTSDVLRELATRDNRVVSIELTRNFGHQAALTAGLSIATANFVITMDGDGQHPPELIPTLINHVRGDFDVVLTVRRTTVGSVVGKRLTSTWFYRILNWMSDTRLAPGAADYRALRQEVADSLRRMPEYHRFVRGMVSWLGYRTVAVEYDAPQRIAGSSKYSIGKMFKLALDAIFSFSLVPLQISVALGLVFLVLAATEAAYVVSFWIRGDQQLLSPGWSSLMFMLLIIGGMLMIMLGILGAYVGYTLQEVKGRPIFVIKSPQSTIAGGQAAANVERVDQATSSESKRFFYEDIAPLFERLQNSYDVRRRLDVIQQELERDHFGGGIALDAGCGSGEFSALVHRRAPRVVSLDISLSLVRLTVLKAHSLGVVADALALPFRSDAFDLVVSSEMVEHTLRPLDAVHELVRVLRPAGLLVVTTPNHRWEWLVRLASKVRVRPFHGYENFIGFRELATAGEVMGLDGTRHFGFHPWPFQIAFLRQLSAQIDTLYGHRLWGASMINQVLVGHKPLADGLESASSDNARLVN